MKSINSEVIKKSIEDILDLFKDDFMLFKDDFIIREYFNDKSRYIEIINEIKKEKLLKSKKQEKEEKRVQSLKYRQSEIVMITETGATFHKNEECWALRNSKNIKKVTISDAIKQGKEKGCKLCD